MAAMHRRDLLKAGLVLGGAFLIDGCRPGPHPGTGSPGTLSFDSVLDHLPAESGIDHVVVVMMENRSFDSYLGWLPRNEGYMELGRARYGSSFTVRGDQFQTFPDPTGAPVDTYRRVQYAGDADPWRACGHPDPGHGWNPGRAQRDGGFLATGSNNDIFALGYFEPGDLPVYAMLALNFTACDQWHCSILGPTYPNREYLLSAQSGGNKSNTFPDLSVGFEWPTIVDRLVAGGVSCADYFSDLPPLALWGPRMHPLLRPISTYYEDAAAGTLPAVSFVSPVFVGDNRTDDHPHGDPRAAQAFVRDVFRAFATSPNWERGLFILTYDEWGGFFDHIRPPLLPDDRASTVDQDNFGQAGFRVPTIFCSPRVLPGAIDHTRYDHTSVLRFLEWRFLGAPARGAGGSASWSLTARDRNANNPGEMISAEHFDPTVGFDVNLGVQAPSPPCGSGAGAFADAAVEPSPWEEGLANGYWESVGIPVPAGAG
jgi:phospholipase C